MKQVYRNCRLTAAFFFVLVAYPSYGQGQFDFIMGGTRLYAADGPYAGPDIWAQMLVGLTPDQLSAVDVPVRHSGGLADGGIVTVDGIPCNSFAYVQMVAWDGRLWGDSLDNVPADQLGKTDAVLTALRCSPLPIQAPFFAQPAIVPIPEPSFYALGLAGGLSLLLMRRRECQRPTT